jgi:RNase P/RNase MRP subunit POP5
MKQKKLKLMPSARENRRYFYMNSNDRAKIEKAILDYIGILGFSKSAFMFVETPGGKLVGSCLRESLENVRASLAFARIKIQKVSGTIKGLTA